MPIGDRLREARRNRRLSLQQVAERTGISAATLSRIETGKQSLDVKLFLHLSEILETPAANFLEPAQDSDGMGDLRRTLMQLPRDLRSELWASLAEDASGDLGRQGEPITNRLAELLAQIDLVRAQIEAMRTHLERRP